MSLRKEHQDVYLIGEITPKISGRKLPTNKQVLQLLFYKTRELNMTVASSIADVFKEVKHFWDDAQIPVKSYYNARKQIDNLYNEYRDLQKFKSRDNFAQLENDFKNKLTVLFDISQKNVIDKLDEEKKNFLLIQQSCHKLGVNAASQPELNVIKLSGNVFN